MPLFRGLPPVLVVATAVVVSACGRDAVGNECGPANCADGCCDSSGICRTTQARNACGVGGETCEACAPGTICSAGGCIEGAEADAGVPSDAGGGDPDAGADGGTDAGVDAGGFTLDAFCDDQLPATCDFFIRCGIAATKSTCNDLFDAIYFGLDLCNQVRPGVAKGRLQFDSAKAEECMEAIRTTASCANALLDVEEIPACAATLVGMVPSGGTCFFDDECSVQDFCTAQSVGACPGSCARRRRLGDSTNRDRECEPGHYAYATGFTSTCQAIVRPGSSCAPLDAAGVLQSCASGHYCDPATERCRAKKGIGASCLDFTECGAHLECRGTCQPFGAIGATCSQFETCQFGLACDSDDPSVPGVCAEPSPIGGDCWFFFDCAKPALNYCNWNSSGNAGECAPRKPLGGACIDPFECQLGTYCALGFNPQGSCAARKAEGVACDGFDFEECEPGLYCDGVCTPSQCLDDTP